MCKEEQNHTKLMPPMYSLHNIHVQISGFHTLIFDFKTDSDRFSEFLIWFGREFYIRDPHCLPVESKPCWDCMQS